VEEAREISGEFSLALEFLTGVYAASGQSEKAREVLADFIELSKRQYVCAYEVATSHAALGDNDEALEWFEKGIEDRADCMPYARTDPKWDYIRDEPRFQELLQQIGPGG
jgi:serine/threonine-protein kinase